MPFGYLADQRRARRTICRVTMPSAKLCRFASAATRADVDRDPADLAVDLLAFARVGGVLAGGATQRRDTTLSALVKPKEDDAENTKRGSSGYTAP